MIKLLKMIGNSNSKIQPNAIKIEVTDLELILLLLVIYLK